MRRANLTEAETRLLLLERKPLYGAMHPETRQEATLKQNRSANLARRTNPSFVADTAAKTGRRSVSSRGRSRRGCYAEGRAAEIS